MRLIDLHEEQSTARFRASAAHWSGGTVDEILAAAGRVAEFEGEIVSRLVSLACSSPSTFCASPGMARASAGEVDELGRLPKWRPNRLLDTGVWQYPILGHPGVPDALGIRAQLQAALYHDVGIPRSLPRYLETA